MNARFLENPHADFTVGINARKVGHGLVFGKFMPLHNGHLYLLNFARQSCSKLTILVCSLPGEPIPGEIRFQWVKRLFPDCNVVHHYAEVPQQPEDSPNFFAIWRDSIARHCPGEEFDATFASEPYGYKMAAVLGAQFIPVDERRELVPISGTKMRENPMKYWEFLHPIVRPYFAKRVAVVGPESCGKSTLANLLAKHFQTVKVNEYARDLLENYKQHIPGFDPQKITEGILSTIARGQAASTEALAEQANKVLIVDTDLITTMYFSQRYLGKCPPMIERMANQQKIDLYLLLDPTGIESSYTPDQLRDMGNLQDRIKYFQGWQAKLLADGLPHIVVTGSDWQARNRLAIAEVEKLLAA